MTELPERFVAVLQAIFKDKAPDEAKWLQRTERIRLGAAPKDAFERVVATFLAVFNGENIDKAQARRSIDELSGLELTVLGLVSLELFAKLEAQPEFHDGYERLAAFVATSFSRRVKRETEALPRQQALSTNLRQVTFPEAKRVAQGLAHGKTGSGWSEIAGGFALVHVMHQATHNLRFEGSLIPAWWGRPTDNESLRAELGETGHDGIAALYNTLGLVTVSADGHVDVDLDELLSRIGIEPRSTAERTKARTKLWRILTVLNALRVVGARRKKIRDRGKMIELKSDDPLIAVSRWHPPGSPLSFDNAEVPLRVTLQASPWLSPWRGNRSVLQEFGDLLRVTKIPIGQPSGAWARAIGHALYQSWREQAARAKYSRHGDDNRPSVTFRPFTRRQLLEILPPEPSVHDILASPNPVRAIKYWRDAIQELQDRGVIGYVGPSQDWEKDRPRKSWADLWLDEKLDIRPPAEWTGKALEIATAAKQKGARRRKLTTT